MQIKSRGQTDLKKNKQTVLPSQHKKRPNQKLKISNNQRESNNIILPRLARNPLIHYHINLNNLKAITDNKTSLQAYASRNQTKRESQEKENAIFNHSKISRHKNHQHSFCESSIFQNQINLLGTRSKKEPLCKKPQTYNSSRLHYKKPIIQKISYSLREKVIDWLQNVCQLYQFKKETFFLALQTFDSYNSIKIGQDFDSSSRNTLIQDIELPQRKIQFTMLVCLFIANKYEQTNFIGIEKFRKDFCQRYFSQKDIIQREGSILNTLKFDLNKFCPFSLVCEVLSQIVDSQAYKKSVVQSFQFIKSQLKRENVHQSLYEEIQNAPGRSENVSGKILLASSAIFNYFDMNCLHGQYQKYKVLIKKHIQEFKNKLIGKNQSRCQLLGEKCQGSQEQLEGALSERLRFAFKPPALSFFNR